MQQINCGRCEIYLNHIQKLDVLGEKIEEIYKNVVYSQKKKFGEFTVITNLEEFEMKLRENEELQNYMVRKIISSNVIVD